MKYHVKLFATFTLFSCCLLSGELLVIVAPSLGQSTQDAAPQKTQPEQLKADNLVNLDARKAQFKIVAGEGHGRHIVNQVFRGIYIGNRHGIT